MWKDSLCPGCGHSRLESFNPANEDAYDTEVLKCFVCAERERTAYKLTTERESKAPPHGLYYAVHGPHTNGD